MILGSTDKRAPGRFCRNLHRPGAYPDSFDQHPGYKYLGEPGAQHRARDFCRRLGARPAMAVLGRTDHRGLGGRRFLSLAVRRGNLSHRAGCENRLPRHARLGQSRDVQPAPSPWSIREEQAAPLARMHWPLCRSRCPIVCPKSALAFRKAAFMRRCQSRPVALDFARAPGTCAFGAARTSVGGAADVDPGGGAEHGHREHRVERDLVML